jgi:hypothetical protein
MLVLSCLVLSCREGEYRELTRRQDNQEYPVESGSYLYIDMLLLWVVLLNLSHSRGTLTV